MTSRQLNIRLTPAARDRLDALAFVRRTHASVLARDIVLAYLDLHAHESGLETAMAALLEREAADRPSANVSKLRSTD